MIEPEKIIRSSRKTIAIVIDQNGNMIVRAPYKASLKSIMKFVSDKQDWIERTQDKAQKRVSRYSEIKCEDNELIYFLGKGFRANSEIRKDIVIRENNIVFPKTGNKVKMLEKWYKQQAIKVFEQRCEYYSHIMGVKPLDIKLSGAKKRFGSCSSQNNINLSWRLVMCPGEVIDYVIVHELSHIVHKNHSHNFWAMVEKYMPDYKDRRKWLRENGAFMEII